MKPLVTYLFVVFLLLCAMLFVVKMIDPPEPVLLITPAAAPAKEEVPSFVCIYVMPPLDGQRKGISRA